MNLEAPPPPRSDNNLSKFQSSKTNGIIHYVRRWHRDAIIQLCLQPDIEQIVEFRQDHNCQCCFELEIVRLGCTVTILLTESADDCAVLIAANDIGRVVLTRDFVLKEPRYSNSKTIWKHRSNPIDVSIRLSLLEKFDMNDGTLTLGQIADQPKTGDTLLNCTMRMICDAEASIDIEQSLTGSTPVKLRDKPFKAYRPRHDISN